MEKFMTKVGGQKRRIYDMLIIERYSLKTMSSKVTQVNHSERLRTSGLFIDVYIAGKVCQKCNFYESKIAKLVKNIENSTARS